MIVFEAITQVAAIMPTAPTAGGGSDDVVGWLDGLVGDVSGLAENAAKAVILIGMAVGLWKAKLSLVPSLATVAVAAFLWWAVGSFGDKEVQDKIDGTVSSSSISVPAGESLDQVVAGDVLAGGRGQAQGSS